MSPLTKKQKIQHGAQAEKRGGLAPTIDDPRFQLNSDFLDSGDEFNDAVIGKGTALPSGQRGHQPGSAGAAAAKRGARSEVQRGGAKPAEYNALSDENDDGDEDDGDGAAGMASGDDGDDDGRGAGAELALEAGDGGGNGYGIGKGASDSANPDDPETGEAGKQSQRKRKKVLTKRKLEQVKEASDRRGIVYISRVPPHMKPHKLRQLLEPFGDIGRVYCAPEDPALRRIRKKKGGNSGKNFTEGWVEFEDKRRAKRAALALNGQPMGGSKRSAYYYDLWNIRYLPKFKWDTLTEEINYQRAVREQRLVAEISAAKRERDFYLSRVDKAKAIDAIQERRRAKQQQQQQPGGGGGGEQADGGAVAGPAAAAPQAGAAGAAASHSGGGGPRFERHFGQRRAKADPVLDERAPVLADDVLDLFGRKRKAGQ